MVLCCCDYRMCFVIRFPGGDGDVAGSAESEIPRSPLHSEGESREQANYTSVSVGKLRLRCSVPPDHSFGQKERGIDRWQLS